MGWVWVLFVEALIECSACVPALFVSTAVHPLLGGGGVESGGLVAGWVCARCWVPDLPPVGGGLV